MRMLEAMSGTRRSQSLTNRVWTPPKEGWVKFNSDGGGSAAAGVHEGNNSIRLVRDIKSLRERPWEVSFKHVYGEESICGWNGEAATRTWFWIASVQFPSISTDQCLSA
ncbi:hypothetical protein PVK06_025215 [Gossypium arboreum]|uniref:Uncharacterized protein n=1 Tax=Gossypium arboreum TaxID=29729 RepID=A0ABR0PGG6_GOSAR|nr:hypothetical protein PVK06_025215 [Gossypium arboreum]